MQVILADDQEATEEARQFKEAAKRAAEATAKEIPQGGGTATKVALQTANRIQPNLSKIAQRPMFVQVQPESRAERQLRRGIETESTQEDELAQSQVFSFVIWPYFYIPFSILILNRPNKATKLDTRYYLSSILYGSMYRICQTSLQLWSYAT